MRKWISIAVIVITIAGGGVWFYQSKQTAAPAAAQVMTTTVEKGDIEVQVSGSGSVASNNSHDITANSEGEVDEVLVKVNEVVEEGDELISFTDGSDPVIASHAGTITSLDVASGNRIQSSQVVGHITDYVTLQTVISIDELDIASIKEEQVAEVTASAFPDETFTGTVTAVSKEGTAQNGVSSFDVTVQIDDPKELLIGMSTEVNITTASKQGVLYVPIESVQVDGKEKYVTLEQSTSSGDENGEITRQVVETGINDDQNIEVTSGLEEGQIVQLAITISSGSESGRGQGGGARFPGGGSSGGFPASGSQGDMGVPPSGGQSGTGRGGE